MKKPTDEHLVEPTRTGSTVSDEELLLRYRETAEERYFAQLVKRYEKELFSYLRRYLNDTTLAEDAFQAAFLQVYLKADQFQAGRKFRPWLYTIATNQAIDASRRNRRHRLVSLDGQSRKEGSDDVGKLLDLLASRELSPEEATDEVERSEWVKGAVEALPEPLRATIHLVYYQGLKYRDAAEVLDIPVGTVKSRMHSAILKLTEAWAESHPAGAD